MRWLRGFEPVPGSNRVRAFEARTMMRPIGQLSNREAVPRVRGASEWSVLQAMSRFQREVSALGRSGGLFCKRSGVFKGKPHFASLVFRFERNGAEVGWRPMGLEGGGCKELPSGGVPWAANTVILALAEREDIMVHWKNRVGVGEIARPCRPGQVHGVARDPPERVVQPGGGPDVVLQDACTAHDKSQRRARRCRRQPLLADPRRLELVARPGTGIGTGSPGCGSRAAS